MAASLKRSFSCVEGIEWLGHVSRDAAKELLSSSKWLVIPSLWYEMCPMVALEGLASGTPLVVPDLGALPGFVEPERTGLIFSHAGSPSLAQVLRDAAAMPNDEWGRLSEAAVTKARTRYSPEVNYEVLTSAYQPTRVEPGQARIFSSSGRC
jgi:glycosyltransferase involved in cell wall biosynthesis